MGVLWTFWVGAGRGLGDDMFGMCWEIVQVLKAAKAQWPRLGIVSEYVNSKNNRREAVWRDYQRIEEIL